MTAPPRSRQRRRRARAGARAVWTVTCGASAAASIGLALLVAGTVFISLAIPRASLGQRTLALRQIVAAAPDSGTSVVGVSDYPTFDSSFSSPALTAHDLAIARADLRANLAQSRLPVLARSAWSGLSTALSPVSGAAASAISSGLPPKLELVYRDALSRYSRVVLGRLPGRGRVGHGRTVLELAVTQATAARLGVRPGSRLGLSPGVTLLVTGVIRPVDPGSTFWSVDPLAAAPELKPPSPPTPAYWIGGAFIGPAGLPLLSTLLPTGTMQLTWDFPLATKDLTVADVPVLQARLTGAVNSAGLVSAHLATPALITLSTGLTAVLAEFSTEDQAIGSVLSLLFVSLAAIGIMVILLGAGLVAGRRGTEFTVLRARGGSLRQLAWRALAAAALLALPALAAAAAAVAVTPGDGLAIAWWLAGCALIAALAGLPVLIISRVRAAERGTRSRRAGRAAAVRRAAATRRLVLECALLAAAIGGIVVLRRQGLTAGSLDLYASAAPALVAIPAAILVVRGYPVVLRLALRLAGARPGVSAFVGLASATRTSLRAVAPVFALILALAVVTFGTMIGAAVRRGEVAVSWRQTGADAIVNASDSSRPVSPATVAAISAVPGAAVTAAVTDISGTLPGGGKVTVAAVSPARYAALVAATPEPAVSAAALARPGRSGQAGPGGTGQRVPALVTAAAAAMLAAHPGGLQVGGRKLAIRVAGQIGRVAGVGGGPLVLLPDWALGRSAPPPSVILVAGPDLDGAALTSTVRRLLPGAALLLRGRVLAALSNAPLPHGADVGIVQSSAAAAAFSALILLISLLITARSRDLTLARLATMGLRRRQARWLTAVETLPQVLAATVGGVACAWALAPLVGPAIDLSAFTGTGTGVPIEAQPLPLAGSAAGLILLAAAALIAQPAITGRLGPARALRVED